MFQQKGSVFMMHVNLTIFLLSILLSFVMVESDGKNKRIKNKHTIFFLKLDCFISVTYPFYLPKMTTAQLTLISGAKMEKPLMQEKAVPPM